MPCRQSQCPRNLYTASDQVTLFAVITYLVLAEDSSRCRPTTLSINAVLYPGLDTNSPLDIHAETLSNSANNTCTLGSFSTVVANEVGTPPKRSAVPSPGSRLP